MGGSHPHRDEPIAYGRVKRDDGEAHHRYPQPSRLRRQPSPDATALHSTERATAVSTSRKNAGNCMNDARSPSKGNSRCIGGAVRPREAIETAPLEMSKDLTTRTLDSHIGTRALLHDLHPAVTVRHHPLRRAEAKIGS